MNAEFIETNDIRLAYDRFGAPTDPAILLVAGLGTQMIRWTDAFCQHLASRGLQVIRFDNRDAGLSTHLWDAQAPDLGAIARSLAQGVVPTVPYSLADMAADTVSLLDGLGIPRAHLAGRSMGGMIAQLVASTYPERVRSLTSIMSSSGNPALPPASPETMALMTRPAPDPRAAPDAYVQHSLEFARHIAGSGSRVDDEAYRALIMEEARRGYDPGGFARQLAAIAVDGDRRSRLATIAAPSLVIHGTEDPLFPPAHGIDTAAAIPGAMLMTIEGMGHDLPPVLNARIIDAIIATIERAESTTP